MSDDIYKRLTIVEKESAKYEERTTTIQREIKDLSSSHDALKDEIANGRLETLQTLSKISSDMKTSLHDFKGELSEDLSSEFEKDIGQAKHDAQGALSACTEIRSDVTPLLEKHAEEEENKKELKASRRYIKSELIVGVALAVGAFLGKDLIAWLIKRFSTGE